MAHIFLFSRHLPTHWAAKSPERAANEGIALRMSYEMVVRKKTGGEEDRFALPE
jgi:hypothetical protein